LKSGRELINFTGVKTKREKKRIIIERTQRGGDKK
jgi:hypothetical protein